MKVKKPKVTKADLQRKARELEAQLASSYHFADAALGRAEFPKLMGSGVILQLTALGGREITNPIMIRDGLSPETIQALRADIKRSYDDATAFAPSGPKPEPKP